MSNHYCSSRFQPDKLPAEWFLHCSLMNRRVAFVKWESLRKFETVDGRGAGGICAMWWMEPCRASLGAATPAPCTAPCKPSREEREWGGPAARSCFQGKILVTGGNCVCSLRYHFSAQQRFWGSFLYQKWLFKKNCLSFVIPAHSISIYIQGEKKITKKPMKFFFLQSLFLQRHLDVEKFVVLERLLKEYFNSILTEQKTCRNAYWGRSCSLLVNHT